MIPALREIRSPVGQDYSCRHVRSHILVGKLRNWSHTMSNSLGLGSLKMFHAQQENLQSKVLKSNFVLIQNLNFIRPRAFIRGFVIIVSSAFTIL